jgi:SAM-dependent methyltransferase
MSQHDHVRGINAAIAGAYDAVVYEPGEQPSLAAPSLFGVGALYGGVPPGDDVLDLGCGTGTLLAAAGATTRGRLAGVDISAAAIARARERCAPFGARAEIAQADFLDLDPARLGRFDLIYHVGVFYVTPPEVRRRLVELIGACLKPGGLLALSYYAGTLPRLRAAACALLRRHDDPAAPTGRRIAAARQTLAQLAAALPERDEARGALLAVLNQLAALSDTVLFHEALGPVFEVIDTPGLDETLAREGVRFATYLTGNGFDRLGDPAARARTAATGDFLRGGYRFALFVKADGPGAPDLRSPLVRWRAALTRRGEEDGLPVYSAAGTTVRARAPVTARMLEALAGGPRTWQELADAAGPFADPAAREAALATLDKDLGILWGRRWAQPFREPGAPPASG